MLDLKNPKLIFKHTGLSEDYGYKSRDEIIEAFKTLGWTVAQVDDYIKTNVEKGIYEVMNEEDSNV